MSTSVAADDLGRGVVRAVALQAKPQDHVCCPAHMLSIKGMMEHPHFASSYTEWSKFAASLRNHEGDRNIVFVCSVGSSARPLSLFAKSLVGSLNPLASLLCASHGEARRVSLHSVAEVKVGSTD